ncbi:MAG TPA: C1 family peptidase [Stenomitos sp.]
MRRSLAYLFTAAMLLTQGCGYYEQLTPAQKATLEQARFNQLYVDYAKAQNLGLGASLDDKPPISQDDGLRGTQDVLPARVDLRPSCPPVYNQGPFRTCTGFAVAKGLGEYLLRRQGDNTPLSANHLYVAAKSAAMDTAMKLNGDSSGYMQHYMDGAGFQDTGTSIASAMAALELGGAVEEADVPYPPASLWGRYWQSNLVPGNTYTSNDPLDPFFEDPPMKTVSGGKVEYPLSPARIRIRLAEPVHSLAAMRRSLAKGMPVVVGFVVHESFYSAQVRKTGRIPLPTATDRTIDGHAMLCVGYDDAQQLLIIRNSWGAEWGDRGYCYLPYAATAQGLLRDCWSVNDTPPDRPSWLPGVG